MRKWSALHLKFQQLTSQTKSNMLLYSQRNIFANDSVERLSMLNGKYSRFCGDIRMYKKIVMAKNLMIRPRHSGR